MNLKLRPFGDGDVSLFRKWLFLPHVAEWYKYPDERLKEIHGRDGEFAWIRRFIAEVDGAAVGFCQYYDCFDNHERKPWEIDDTWDYEKTDAPNKKFCVDYMLGEPRFFG